jgi:hypothetical protein
LKVLKYTEPAKPMSSEGPTTVTTTNRDYDLAEASKAIRGVLMGCLFVRRSFLCFLLSEQRTERIFDLATRRCASCTFT